MRMAKIFRPIRWQSRPGKEGQEQDPAPPEPDAPGRLRQGRVGTQPVTNTSPSGSFLSSLPTTREEGWMALLELVFSETGWPDAE